MYDWDVLINHIRAISKKRVGEKIASVSEDEYAQIVESLCRNFL